MCHKIYVVAKPHFVRKSAELQQPDFERACDFTMDPIGVFHHSDLHREGINQRNWQKVNADRISACQFDASGRYLAVYSSWLAIEIWDVSSIPVPMTSLVMPKGLANKLEGYCHTLFWSHDGKQVGGVFGVRPTFKRKVTISGEVETIIVNDGAKPAYLLTWDIVSRKITHYYR